MFARSLQRAQSATLAVVPEKDHLAAKLNVRCANPEDASAMATELTRATGLLREMIEREHQKANPADLSGFLTSGAFRADAYRVSGYWSISHDLITTLLSGN